MRNPAHSRRLQGALLAGLLVAAALPAAAQPGAFGAWMDSHNGVITQADAEQMLKQKFDELDTDHDGVITQAEFEAHFMQMFHQADSNHDGSLTRSEIRTAALARLRSQDAPAGN